MIRTERVADAEAPDLAQVLVPAPASAPLPS